MPTMSRMELHYHSEASADDRRPHVSLLYNPLWIVADASWRGRVVQETVNPDTTDDHHATRLMGDPEGSLANLVCCVRK
jgi:hypothetical protein